MKISQVIEAYLVSRRSVGVRLESGQRALFQFARELADCPFDKVTPEAVAKFLQGRGPINAAWTTKFKLLTGLYRYAISRGYIDKSPLPTEVPALPPQLTPYVYSTAELNRLADATKVIHHSAYPLQAAAMKSLLLLLYGTGLRVSEALSLKISDVNLRESLLTIRDTKFYKTRLVPAGHRVTKELASHLERRALLPKPDGDDSAVFAIRTGTALGYKQVNDWFLRIRMEAGIVAPPGETHPPRLHDLRHTAVVHRVVNWYRSGNDVQRLIPHLATYLGHVDIKSTQRYLRMTPELLEEASRKFAAYANVEVDHA